jgi:hypothetical protein
VVAQPRSRELSLRGGADDDLADVNPVRLLDRERDAQAIAAAGMAILSSEACRLARISGLVTAPAPSVDVMPGVMMVTRRSGPASWRRPSEIARTAIFVPEYTDMFGSDFERRGGRRVDDVPGLLRPENRQCSDNAVEDALDVDVDHRLPVLHAEPVERRDRHDAGVVDEHVKAAKAVECELDEGRDVVAAADVDAREHGLPAGRRDLCGQRLQSFCPPGARSKGCVRFDETKPRMRQIR